MLGKEGSIPVPSQLFRLLYVLDVQQGTHMTPAPAQDTWTTRRLLDWMQTHFETHDVHAPDVTAQMLLAHVLGVDPILLFTEPDRPAQTGERDRLRALVTRASNQEPVQYIVGQAQFLGRPFTVDPSVLIPRTATESVIQAVLDRQRGRCRRWCRSVHRVGG